VIDGPGDWSIDSLFVVGDRAIHSLISDLLAIERSGGDSAVYWPCSDLLAIERSVRHSARRQTGQSITNGN
jgi:hypothetical protein